MGQVWQAARSDGLYQRRVALKLLRPGLADPNLRLRFTRERQILARLAHPHIARLLDAGVSADHQPYLALDYIEGEPITDYCRNRKLSLDSRLHLFAQICSAVSHAHANLIVHRDLKPSNILVSPAGEVRLLDFGIAKLLDMEQASPEHTRTGVRAFTLHYAAPEQIRGEPVSTMTDVYSLGVVLYELLTDAKPYRLKRQTDAEWEEAILLTDPLKPSQTLLRAADATDRPRASTSASTSASMRATLKRRARIVAGDLDNIVLKTLAKNPEQRYPSVEALALDLERYRLGKPVQARRAGRRLPDAEIHRAAPLGAGDRARWSRWCCRRRWRSSRGRRGRRCGKPAAPPRCRTSSPACSRPRATRRVARRSTCAHCSTPASSAATASWRWSRVRAPKCSAWWRGCGSASATTARRWRLLERQAAILDALDNVPTSLQLESVTLRGRAQYQLGQQRDCIETMQPWLATARREQAQLSPQVAEFYSRLARCRRALGERNTARQLFERSLALRRDALDDKVGVVENLVDLAALHADAGESVAAMDGLQAALAQLRQQVGYRHPLAISILRSIGAQQRDLGNVTAAEAAYREALALADDLHGPAASGHPRRAPPAGRRSTPTKAASSKPNASCARSIPCWSNDSGRGTWMSAAATTALASSPGNVATLPARSVRSRRRSRSGAHPTAATCCPAACSTRRWCCTQPVATTMR